MNILIINHYAGSPEMGMEFRPYYLAQEWKKNGHNVIIVGATYSHLRKKQPEKSGEQAIDGIDYLWVKTPVYKGNGIKRFISMLVFTIKLWIKAKRIAKTFCPDVVIASSTYPLDNYSVNRIAKFSNSKHIYEIHDIWPLSPMELGGMSKFHPFIVLMQMAENYAYKHSDAVVSILPAAKEHCVEHGLPESKFFHVPNGIVEADWQVAQHIPETHSKLISHLKSNNSFLVGFTGAHGVANALQSVIKAVAMLKDKNISLILVGSGQEKENLMNYVKKNEIGNVYFLPPVSKYAIPDLLGKMDVLYIGLQKQSLFRFGISPNKIFDYMMAGKPVVQAIEAGNDIVSEAHCGFSVEPENEKEISYAIEKISVMSDSERVQLGQNGREYVLENHTYSIIAKKFFNILNSL